MPAVRAIGLLEKAGLVPQRRHIVSTKPKDTVVSAQPPARSTLARKATVVLMISNGPALAVVPSLIGQPEPQGVSSLTALGLKANVFRVASGQAQGTVVAQNPSSGTKARKGAQVRLNVATGPPPAFSRPRRRLLPPRRNRRR